MSRFQPAIPDSMTPLFASPDLLFAAIEQYQRPLLVSEPSIASNAVRAFQNVASQCSLNMKIFAAHKATDSRRTVRSLGGLCGIDVASIAELEQALSDGFLPQDIVASGPKNKRFLQMLLENNITIAVDSAEEVERLSGLLSPRRTCDVLLRLSRSVTNMPGIEKKGRFGLDKEGLKHAIEIAVSDARIIVKGVSFHIDTSSLDEKAYAVGTACMELLALQKAGFVDAVIVDIGGGFGGDYAIDNGAVDQFIIDMRQSLHEPTAAITWQGYTYGLERSSKLQGIDTPSTEHGAQKLQALLQSSYDGQKIADMLSDNLIELWIEPGSALFAAGAVIVAPVIETRTLDSEKVTVVDIHRNQLHFNDSEMLIDPVLVKHHQSSSSQLTSTTLFGHLCLESDVLSYRTVQLDGEPEPGDLIVWTHVGAYRGYFGASSAIGHPLCKKLIMSTTRESYVLEEDV